MKNSFVIKGNICQTKNPKELDLHENAYAVCVDGVSKGVFDSLPEEYAALPLYDYQDALIFPGMVDLHIHAPQYAFRGMCMDLELMEWLNRYTFPEEEKYEDLAYAEKAYGLFVDALKKGATTRACIFATRHRPATELLMKLMEESGLVSFVGKVNMDREASAALTEDSADISAYTTFGWINAVKDRFQNTKPILTPRFIPCCSDQLMEELRQTQQMDNGLFATYTNIFFIPMDVFGVRLLRIITVPNWPERIMKGLFKPEVRSYGRGSFTYDAYDNGIYFLSFLDGDLWRLFRFREAILSREGNFCVYCFHEQVDFLRQYLGDRIRFATVSIESVERVFKIEEKCLL